MKNLVLLLAAALVLFTSCKKDESNMDEDIAAQINNFPIESLNADELECLIMMREEEKLAHDVYTSLYDIWGQNIFNNIASSEQTHTNAVLALLNKYGLTDPVGNNALGVFTDSTMQTLYTSLVAQGSVSSLSALIVGATIEDLDIFDLDVWLTKVDNQDIVYVFENLNKGSRNHIRSFYSQIVNAGGSYEAQFISPAKLDSIVTTAKETGNW